MGDTALERIFREACKVAFPVFATVPATTLKRFVLHNGYTEERQPDFSKQRQPGRKESIPENTRRHAVPGFSIPMASVGQLSSPSMASRVSSSVSGCLNTTEKPDSSSRRKTAGATHRHWSQSMHPLVTKNAPGTFPGNRSPSAIFVSGSVYDSSAAFVRMPGAANVIR